MYRIISFSLLLFFAVQILYAEKVVESELSRGHRVRFVKYRGRYTRIMPLQEVRSIGIGLGGRAEKDNTRYRRKNEFSVIRARGAGRFYNADIFHIDEKADIVDIKSIRTIIGAYLEKRYRYTEKDGLLLAKFITFYNAYYRGKVGYFRTKYNPEVMRHLSRRNAGISRFYYYWPGRSRVLIPISKEGGKQTITSIDPSELTRKSIIDDLRKRRDRGVPDRREMLDLKQRQNKERRKKLEDLKKRSVQREETRQEEQRKLQEDTSRQEQARQEADKIDRDLGKKKVQLLKETDPKKQRKLQDDINRAEKKREEVKKEVKQLDDAVKKREKKVEDSTKKSAEDKEKIEKLEDTIKKKETENKEEQKLLQKDEEKTGIKPETTPDQERKELEQRERELQRKAKLLKEKEQRLKDRKIFKGTLYYLKVTRMLSGGHYNNMMMLIDPINRKVLRKSSFVDICGRKYDVFSDGAVVIGHKGGHANQHFLVLLDHKELKPKATGDVDIYFRSFVEIREGSVFAIYKDGLSYRLGRFDASMRKVAGSDVTVAPDTFITFFEKYLYLNSPEKGILVLDRNTLKRVGAIQP